MCKRKFVSVCLFVYLCVMGEKVCVCVRDWVCVRERVCVCVHARYL